MEMGVGTGRAGGRAGGREGGGRRGKSWLHHQGQEERWERGWEHLLQETEKEGEGRDREGGRRTGVPAFGDAVAPVEAIVGVREG